MTDYIKDKLIKSILEADLIIDEINNKYWEDKITRITLIILFLFVCYFLIKSYFESKEGSKENN